MPDGQSAQVVVVPATAHFDDHFANLISCVIATDSDGGIGLTQSAPNKTCEWVALSPL
jgi:hypothetical protein